MLNVLSQLLNYRRNGETTAAFIEVVDALTALRDSASPVTVTATGVPSFRSKITALNAKHRVLVIDPPSNQSDKKLLWRGQPLTFATTTHERKIVFNSQFLEPLAPDINMGLQIAMPWSLDAEQSRGALRVLLCELQQSVQVMLLPSTNQPIRGKVTNISRLGLGLKTDSELPSYLKQGDNMVDCEIALSEAHNISCKVEIRNVRKSNGSLDTYVGGRLLGVSRHDYDRLSDFIERLQKTKLNALVKN